MIRVSPRAIALAWFLMLCFAPAASVAAKKPSVASDTSAAPRDSSYIDWNSVPEYRIVPGDVLTLDFGPRADLNGDIIRELTVRPDGRISVFPVGDVVAAGRTPRELEGVLVQLLSADIRAPRVTVELTTMAANKVHVLGEVERPGSYTADPFMTVVQAITAAGGFKIGANRNAVLVFSRNGSTTVNVSVVQVDNEIKSGGLSGDLPLSRFDIVYVPRGPVGNLEAYSRMVFGSFYTIGTSTIVGWELFHLERVFPNNHVTLP